jgi:hypothetical protein
MDWEETEVGGILTINAEQSYKNIKGRIWLE